MQPHPDTYQTRTLGESARKSLRYMANLTKSCPRKLPLKDSCMACAFLLFYVGVYLAVGFAGMAALAWVWTKLLS
jgi:hypothetical protein